MALWHPKGALVRQMLEDLIRREVLRRGYQPVYSPHVAREQLLETSGHLAHYGENLFGGMELEGQRYLWWNFVSSRKERIDQAKEEWKSGKFALVPGDEKEFIPLPEN